MSLMNEWAKVRNHIAPTSKETQHFLGVVLAFGFIVSFNSWGAGSFDAFTGLQNLLGASLVCALFLAVHHAAQRLAALRFDCVAQQRVSPPLVLLAVILAFIFRGHFWLLAATATLVEGMPLHRLGHFRYKTSTLSTMVVLAAGPAATGMLTLVIWGLSNSWGMQGDAVLMMVRVGLAMTFMNLLPIPPLDGAYIFFVHRGFLAGILAGAVGLGIGVLAGFTGLVLIATVLACLVLGWWAWNRFVEEAGSGPLFEEDTGFVAGFLGALAGVVLGLIAGVQGWTLAIIGLICFLIGWWGRDRYAKQAPTPIPQKKNGGFIIGLFGAMAALTYGLTEGLSGWMLVIVVVGGMIGAWSLWNSFIEEKAVRQKQQGKYAGYIAAIIGALLGLGIGLNVGLQGFGLGLLVLLFIIVSWGVWDRYIEG